MKATLYNEQSQPIEPVDEHKLAIATEKPAKVEPPRQNYYIVNYKTLVKPTIIAFVIFVIWIVAEFVF